MKIQEMSKEDLLKCKTVYEKINFWSCLVAFIMALASCAISIVIEFATVNIYVCLAFSIVVWVIALLAVILMIISWAVCRRIEKHLKNFEEEDEKATD